QSLLHQEMPGIKVVANRSSRTWFSTEPTQRTTRRLIGFFRDRNPLRATTRIAVPRAVATNARIVSGPKSGLAFAERTEIHDGEQECAHPDPETQAIQDRFWWPASYRAD